MVSIMQSRFNKGNYNETVMEVLNGNSGFVF